MWNLKTRSSPQIWMLNRMYLWFHFLHEGDSSSRPGSGQLMSSQHQSINLKSIPLITGCSCVLPFNQTLITPNFSPPLCFKQEKLPFRHLDRLAFEFSFQMQAHRWLSLVNLTAVIEFPCFNPGASCTDLQARQYLRARNARLVRGSSLWQRRRRSPPPSRRGQVCSSWWIFHFH